MTEQRDVTALPLDALGPCEVVVNDVRYVREATLFAAMQRVEQLEAALRHVVADSPGTPDEQAVIAGPPEGYIVPEGDERCDFTMDACICMKRKGHDGLHACAHGGWR